MDEIDCAVIGAGVVGLAVARALALAGREVLVLESEGAIGTGTSSRNSEVIHAGIYYPQGSLKARLCVEGKRTCSTRYAAERGVPHRRCGKLIVATCAGAGRASSMSIARQGGGQRRRRSGAAHRAAGAWRWSRSCDCVAALHSPSTGIVDSHALMLSLLGDLENAGGMLALKSPIVRAECGEGAIVLMAEDGTALRCRSVVNAAGLGAPALARRFEGLPAVGGAQRLLRQGQLLHARRAARRSAA